MKRKEQIAKSMGIQPKDLVSFSSRGKASNGDPIYLVIYKKIGVRNTRVLSVPKEIK